MNYREYQYYILCEDKVQFYLIRGWLLKKGVQRRKIIAKTPFPVPGDAARYVERRFEETRSFLKSRPPNTCLVVMCDVDNETVSQVEQRYTIGPREKIFLLLPKWSVETWLAFLNEPAKLPCPCEDVTMKNRASSFNPGKLGQKLAQMDLLCCEFQQKAPPSLKLSIERVARKKLAAGL